MLNDTPPANPLAAPLPLPAAKSTPLTTKPYLDGLNALRAVAALSVCLYHGTGGMLPKLIVPAAKQAFSYGYLGVDIFFVISGFIIPYSLIGKGYRVAGFFGYLKKRVVRINPPAYLSLLFILAQWFFIDKVINHDTHYTGSLSAGQLINNLLFTIPFTHYAWISTLFWTLAIEFQFYIFIGLFFNRLFSHGIAWFLGFYLLAAVAALLPGISAIGFLHYSPMFALGGLALLWQQRRLSGLVYVAALLAFSGLAYWQLGLYATLVGLGTAVAINAVTFRIPGLAELGKVSFSLYLFHGIIATTAEFFLIRFFPPTTDARKLVLMTCCLALAIAGSFVLYELVEKPFMKLAKQRRP